MGYKVIGMETKRYMTAAMSWSRACDKFYWLPDPLEVWYYLSQKISKNGDPGWPSR